MNLKEYFEKNRIDPITFSYENKISITSIYRYLRGEKPNFRTACKIEKITGGTVTVEELRKDNGKSI